MDILGIILLIIVLSVLFTFAYSVFRAIGWLPTRSRDVTRFLQQAGIKPGDKVYDLGCGDGRVLFAAATAGANAHGFEVSLMPYVIAKLKQAGNRYRKKVKVQFKDFWGANLSDADLVYFFLIPRIYPKLKRKLEKELKPGTKVVAYVWPIEGWTPEKVDMLKNQNKIYLYKIK